MNRTQTFTRLGVALVIAAAIGAQIPVSRGTALAADGYPRKNVGKLATAGVIGAIFFRTKGKGGSGGAVRTSPPSIPDVPVAAMGKDCLTATLTGDGSKSLYDVLSGERGRFSGVQSLVGDCDEVLSSLKNDDPLTFLAPENDALGQVSPATVSALRADKSKLCELLKDHILIGRYKYEDLCKLADGKRMLLLSGNTVLLRNTGGKITLNGVEVAPVDMAASNGWIHPVKGMIRTGFPN
jgi:uncharacterized surface protein with fasciclin (FAS1) repeats